MHLPLSLLLLLVACCYKSAMQQWPSHSMSPLLPVTEQTAANAVLVGPCMYVYVCACVQLAVAAAVTTAVLHNLVGQFALVDCAALAHPAIPHSPVDAESATQRKPTALHINRKCIGPIWRCDLPATSRQLKMLQLLPLLLRSLGVRQQQQEPWQASLLLTGKISQKKKINKIQQKQNYCV